MSQISTESASLVIGQDFASRSQTLIYKNILSGVMCWGDNNLKQEISLLDNLQKIKTEEIKTISQFHELLGQIARKFININLVLGIIIAEESIFLGVIGEGAVLIKRGTHQGWVLRGAGVISGNLKDRDVLFLAAGDWWKKLNSLDLSESFGLKSSQEAAENLTLKLYQKSQIPTVSGLITYISIVSNKSHLPRYPQFSINIVQRLKNLLSKFKFKNFTILGLILILFISIAAGLIVKNSQRKQSQSSDKLSQITHTVNEGIDLIELNPLRSRELLKNAIEDLKAENMQSVSAKDRQTVKDYLTKAEQGLIIAQKIYEITPQVFFDLNLIKSAARGDKLFIFDNIILISDKTNHAVYSLSIQKKSSKILAGDAKLNQIVAVVTNAQENYVLIDGIYQVNNAGALSQVIKKDEAWKNIQDMYFYGGNLYLLDVQANQIWKYIRTETGFSEINRYFNPDTLVDLSTEYKLAINGSVWISGGAKILKFTGGMQDNWQIQNLPDELGTQLLVYTSDNSQNVYILDKLNNRVIQTDKTGMYLSQYHWGNTQEIADFVVSEDLKQILLLENDKIYGIGLQ